jgi:hypothetical protein
MNNHPLGENSPFGRKVANLVTLIVKRSCPKTAGSLFLLPGSCFPDQGCQMVYFQTKNPNFGKFLRVLQWTLLVYFMAIYVHLVYFMAVWYGVG